MVSEKGKKIKLKKIKIPLFASFLLALSFVFLKYVYLELNFWSAFIWTKIGSFLIALVFILIWQEVRQGVFRATGKVNKKTALIFLLNQTAGAGANILQNLAVFLVPLGYLAFVNALQGVQYVFLFLFSLFLKSEKLSKLVSHLLRNLFEIFFYTRFDRFIFCNFPFN